MALSAMQWTNRLQRRLAILVFPTLLGLAACSADPGSTTRGIEMIGAGTSTAAPLPLSSAPAKTTRKTPRIQVDIGSHAAPIRGIDMTPDQSLVVTVSDDKTARIWDARSGQLRNVLRPEVGEAEVGRLYAVAIHPTQDLVAVAGTTAIDGGEHKILLFQTSNGQYLRAFSARAGNIKQMAWSQSGLLLASYDGDHGLRSFRPDGQMVFEDKFASASYGLDVSPDGRQVAATSLNNQVHLYTLNGQSISKRGTWTTQIPRPRDVAFSPDSRRLAVAYVGDAKEPGAPTVFDLASGKVVRQFQRPRLEIGNLRSLAWSPDGESIFAGGSGYQTVGKHPIFEFAVKTGRVSSQTIAARNSITDMLVSNDGSLLFAGFDGSWGRIQNGPVRKADWR